MPTLPFLSFSYYICIFAYINIVISIVFSYF